MELIQGKLNSPTNEKIGRFFNIKESTVRDRKKNNPTLFEQNLREYRLKNEPFISLEDYNLENETDFKPEDIESGKIPGILNKDGTYLVPTTLLEALVSFEQIINMKKCHVISPANFKGGVGKTGTSINLSVILSFFGFKVLVVDFDLQGNTTQMFDLYRYKKNNTVDTEITKIEELYDLEKSDFKYTIVDLICEVGKSKVAEMTKEAIVNLNDKTKTKGRIDILPNSCNIENVIKFEYVDMYLNNYGNKNKALDEVLSYVKDDYDFVIIDTPPSISFPLRMAAMASDYFIIILTADKLAKDGIAPFLVPIQMQAEAYRREKGKDIKILGGVLNKYQETSNIQRNNKDIIEETLNISSGKTNLGEANLFQKTIKYSNIFNEAQYTNGAIINDNPTNEIVRDFFLLSLEIIDKIIEEN